MFPVLLEPGVLFRGAGQSVGKWPMLERMDQSDEAWKSSAGR